METYIPHRPFTAHPSFEEDRNAALNSLDLSAVDPENVQFGSATWISDQWPNSYVVQVMPDRYKGLDKARISYAGALELEKIRDAFFAALGELGGHNT
ncbi:MAG: hypothetical protein KJO60_06155 [Desulfofustis sp.]|nr:hypothetical protein [Desulfofustis sp.]MBT8354083.1 hypothetical protein [Desulfofustis sp.]NNF47617.1 hypothetical protein [Desulfofustis sp.]NNK58605.1 hypothetical protein [Desulfofustis sp.]